MTSQSPEEGSTVKDEKAVVKDDLSGRELWDEVRISPVEIAMPGGVGLTLRAYRLASELTPTEIEADEDDPFEARDRAAAARAAEEEGVDEFAALVAEGDSGTKAGRKSDGTVTTEDGEVVEEPDAADFADEPEEEEEESPEDEEVPIFLSHRGKLLTFKTPPNRLPPSSVRVLRTTSHSSTPGRPSPSGYSRPTSTPRRTTATSWTSWWRICAAGTTRGTCRCSSRPASWPETWATRCA
nr:hypothetical protein GCM10020092_010860 [Actinoplanes digitatis]